MKNPVADKTSCNDPAEAEPTGGLGEGGGLRGHLEGGGGAHGGRLGEKGKTILSKSDIIIIVKY